MSRLDKGPWILPARVELHILDQAFRNLGQRWGRQEGEKMHLSIRAGQCDVSTAVGSGGESSQSEGAIHSLALRVKFKLSTCHIQVPELIPSTSSQFWLPTNTGGSNEG